MPGGELDVAAAAVRPAEQQAQPPLPVARAWEAARRALPAVAGYAALRIVSMGAYAALVDVLGRYGQRSLLTPVDSGWYRLIAVHGYSLPASRGYSGSVFGYFPLYPVLMHYGALATGLSVEAVGLAVTWLAALAGAWALFEIGARLRSPRTGVLLAALWAVAPAAVTESIAYADTLAIALSAWSLYALLRRSWLAAAVLAALAGFTRPTAVAAAAAVSLAALAAIVHGEPGGRGWRVWAAGLLAPAGTAAFVAYVAVRTGRLDGYLIAQQQGWQTHPDGGVSTAKRLLAGLVMTDPVYRSAPAIISTIVLIAVPVLIAIQIKQRQPWPLIVYTVVVAGLVYGDQHLYTTSPREMLALFPLLLPAARALDRIGSTRWLVVLLAVLGLASAWYGAYAMIMQGTVP